MAKVKKRKKKPETKIVSESCFYCFGSGHKQDYNGNYDPDWVVCSVCHGTGRVDQKYEKRRVVKWVPV